MKYNFSKLLDLVIVVFVVALIWRYISSVDSDNTGFSPNPNYHDAMVVCPICNGSGRYNSQDIFMSQMACTGCGGRGKVQSSQLMNIMNLHTPSVSSSSSGMHNGGRQSRECTHCHGTGVCKTCNGSGIFYGSYGLDPLECPNCLSKKYPGKGKCRWCSGTGRRR